MTTRQFNATSTTDEVLDGRDLKGMRALVFVALKVIWAPVLQVPVPCWTCWLVNPTLENVPPQRS